MRYGRYPGKRTQYCVDLPHKRIPNLEAALVYSHSILEPSKPGTIQTREYVQ